MFAQNTVMSDLSLYENTFQNSQNQIPVSFEQINASKFKLFLKHISEVETGDSADINQFFTLVSII